MRTELIDVPLVPEGGKQVNVHPQALQNARLLPLGDHVSRFAIWCLEAETNNVGSAVTPSDAKNCQKFKTSLLRMWERVVKFNRSTPTSLEFTHPIRFIALTEIQQMPNTPLRQLNYVLWRLFQTLLGGQGAGFANFVDEDSLVEVKGVLDEVVEFIDVEVGDGTPSGNDDGLYNVGAGMPAMGRIGILKPTPLAGEVSVSEPSSAPPRTLPGDVPDV